MRPDELDAASLSEPQRELLRLLAESELASAVYLTGGTALAGFYLHHRASDDLDFFFDEEIPLPIVQGFLASIPGFSIRTFQRLFDRRIFLLDAQGAPLKVEFTRYPFPRSTALFRLRSGLAVDPPDEILLNKLAAMVDRREPKDYVDVYFLLRTAGMPGLPSAIKQTEAKFGIRGLRYLLQPRLLAVPSDLPPTQPKVARADVERAFRALVDDLIATASES